MKKAAIILLLLLSGLFFGQAQNLSVIKDGTNYLLVRSQKSEQTKVDSTQLKKLTITTISTEFIPVSSIQTEVKNLAILNRLIVNNYDLIKKGEILKIDSVINIYSTSKPWLKERIHRIYIVKQENDLIDCKLQQNSKSIIFNFEFLLLLLSLIFIVYLDFSNLKIKKYFENIMITSFFFALLISYPYSGVIENIVISLIMTGILLLIVLNVFINVKAPFRLSVIITYAVLVGFIQHSIVFTLMTFAIGYLTIIILWLTKQKRKPSITIESTSK